MPQVNPSLPADNVLGPKSRTAPRTSVENGFSRQLEDEVHKLGDSANPQSAPARNTSASHERTTHRAKSQSEDAASSTTGIQDARQEGPGLSGLRPIVHPATLEGRTVSDGQSKDTNVESSGKSSADIGNLAASNVLAVLAVLLFSSIESTGQNLPTEVSDPKRNEKEPNSVDGQSSALPFPNDASNVPAIHLDRPIETAHQQPPYLNLITLSVEEKGAQDREPASIMVATGQKAQNSASLLSKQALPSDDKASPDAAGSPLEERIFDTPLSSPASTESNSTPAVIRESLDASDPESVLRASIKALSIEFQSSVESKLNALPRAALVTSKSERLPFAPAETDPAASEVNGSSDQLVQEEIEKVLTNLLSRDVAQTKATTTPGILVEPQETVQTQSLWSATKQTADTKLKTTDLPLNTRGIGPERDLDHQTDPILLTAAQARVKGPTVENQANSFNRLETRNLRRELLEAKEGTLGDNRESGGSVARESLRVQATSPHQQLANRREEASSGQGTAQADRVSKAELISRSFMKNEAPVMSKEGEELGAPSLAAIGHLTLSTSESAGSGTERAAAVPLASNAWEQVEKAKVIAQLVEKAHLIGGKNDGELVISLKPEFLGRISLRASMVEKTLVATLVAESSHVRDLLESQLPVLQHSLHEHGLPVAKVVVLQGNELSFSDASKGQPGFQQNPGSRQATPHLYRHDDPLQETEEPELSSISPIPHRPYYSRSINLIA